MLDFCLWKISSIQKSRVKKEMNSQIPNTLLSTFQYFANFISTISPIFRVGAGVFENKLQTLKSKEGQINSECKDYTLIPLVPSTMPENSRCSEKTG